MVYTVVTHFRHWPAETHANRLLGSAKPGHIEPSDRPAAKKTDDGYQGTGCACWISSNFIKPPPLSCPRGRRRASRSQADGNVAAVSHGQHVPTPTSVATLHVKAALSKGAWWPWPFDLESGVRVTCDVVYLCGNFGLPMPLCSRLRPDVCDTQTDVRQKHRLMPHLLGAGHNNCWLVSGMLRP